MCCNIKESLISLFANTSHSQWKILLIPIEQSGSNPGLKLLLSGSCSLFLHCFEHKKNSATFFLSLCRIRHRLKGIPTKPSLLPYFIISSLKSLDCRSINLEGKYSLPGSESELFCGESIRESPGLTILPSSAILDWYFLSWILNGGP